MKSNSTRPIRQLEGPLTHAMRVPGSKSITNRALVLAAMSPSDSERVLRYALQSEDTEVMIQSLRRLGISVEPDWTGDPPRVVLPAQERARIPVDSAEIFVANSGTSMRFLTAMLATGRGEYRLDGIPRMRQRPMQELLDALQQLGVDARSEAGNGCPPIRIRSTGLRGGHVTLTANRSSQFLSALLLAAPFASSAIDITVTGTLSSEPYVDMTLAMLQQWGVAAHRDGRHFHVQAGQSHAPEIYAIEADASAASYFFASAAIVGGRVTVFDTKHDMLQGDIRFVDLLEQMGCDTKSTPDGIRVSRDPRDSLHGIDVDMNAISDTVMTLAAVACFADTPTTIRNVAHIRHKETDRITALCTELRKLGIRADELADGLRIHPAPMTGCTLETYDDHRMAMSLALIGLRVPGVVISNPGCVAKTYPGFWDDFDRLYISAS